MLEDQLASLMVTQNRLLNEKYVKHVKIKAANDLYNIYEFKDEIGQGAFGRVVEVIQKSTMKPWAMKIVLKNKVNTAQWQELEMELKILKFVNHPHIISLECVYESLKKMYIVLEKCNHTLLVTYEKKKPFSEKIAKIIIRDLVDAINYLHKNNIVHRDIKLENILILLNESDPKDEYYIKLADFGLSMIKCGQGVEGMMNDIVGTLSYMAPEIVNSRSYSELCDVWSIGVLMYMFLFGTKPFTGSTEETLLYAITNKEPTYDTGSLIISLEATNLIKNMLKKNPVYRIMTTQISNHPWLSKKKLSEFYKEECNIFNVMDEWKKDMIVSNARKTSDLLLMPNYEKNM